MTTPIRLECPHCHHRGSTSQMLLPGTKVRCPSCRKLFACLPRADEAHLDAEVEEPLPEAQRPVEMGGRSVFSQKELVETVSEETVAKALATSQNEAGRRHRFGLGVMAVFVLIGVGLLSMLALKRVGDSTPRVNFGKPPETARVEPQPLPKSDPWKATIEKSLLPGPEPSRRGSGTRDWKTGQQLMVDNGAQDQVPNTARWGIVEVYQPDLGPKQQFYVRLQEKVPLNVLRLITRDVLLKASQKYEITYVSFVTSWQLGESRRGFRERLEPSKARFWALCMLTIKPKPELSIRINGVTVEDEALLKAVPLPPATKIIGTWIDEERGGRLTIYRTADDRLYLEELSSSGKRHGEDHELLELPSSDGRRFEDKSPLSDRDVSYFMIDESGDLQTRFKDGMVWKARSIELN